MRALSLLLVLLFSLPIAALAQEAEDCNGPYKDKSLSPEELEQVLKKQKRWYRMNYMNLNAPSDKTLPGKTSLCDANLKFANLNGAELRKANLTGANLTGAHLIDAKLDDANLTGANLTDANLTDANVRRANLTGANLTNAHLIDAFLSWSNLTDTNLTDAYLGATSLYRANLTGANLERAVLYRTNLTGTNLTDAFLWDADLAGAIYGPKAGHHPPVDSIAGAKGLSRLDYDQPRALVGLRKLFKDGGYRNQERQITYAIHHVRNSRLLNDTKGSEGKVGSGEGFLGRVEGAFNFVLFELTTKWGLAPSRALLTIAVLILIFSLVYVIALRHPAKDGIWRIWANERVRSDLGSSKPELLSATGFSSIRLAFYFSLLSAFHIGWRDLNVGNWITRVQSREYTLSASGWVRTVSGMQSLLSVYLLAIWALTHFGRPFG